MVYIHHFLGERTPYAGEPKTRTDYGPGPAFASGEDGLQIARRCTVRCGQVKVKQARAL